MGRYTARAQEGLFDYIYEHLPEFELLLRRAAGTEYAHYIDELVEIEVTAWIRPGRSTMSASSTAITWQDLKRFFILKTSGSAKGRFSGGLFIEPKVSNN